MALSRGFASVEDHDEHIIEKWNSVVSKRDVTYILGDITMEKKEYSILDRLLGRKVVLLGNHYMPQHIPELLKHVTKVAGSIKYKGYFLTHIPVHPMEFDCRIRGNIHGHIHKLKIDDERYICVSCEQVDYTPISINFN